MANGIDDLTSRLDKIWKTKCRLERECRIQFQKLDAIPELDGENVILNSEIKSKLLKRMKYLRLTEVYRNLLICCESLGFVVKRSSSDGHHLITSGSSGFGASTIKSAPMPFESSSSSSPST